MAFRPIGSNGFSACNCFTARIDDKNYVALFSWDAKKNSVVVDAEAIGAAEGSVWKDLWTGKELIVSAGKLAWNAEGCDALILVNHV